MRAIASAAVSLVLAGFIAWTFWRSPGLYRRAKAAVAAGDPKARSSLYLVSLRSRVVSGALALLAVALGPITLDPRVLGLGHNPIVRMVPGSWKTVLVAGLIGAVTGELIRRTAAARRGPAPPTASRWRPDFHALIPVTLAERWLGAVVAIGAGTVEELVFRGWLFGALHTYLGLSGAIILVVGVAIYGLGHWYQGPVGVLTSSFEALVFGVVYVGTCSLIVPMVLHTVVDLRVIFMRAPPPPSEGATT